MLTREIAPFADYHIEKLTKLRETLLKTPGLYFEGSEDAVDDLQHAISAFVRFKMCMIDEHKMKERAERQARLCRIHHKQD